MIGRGSRILKNKNSFDVIDLGNNFHRFGPWGSTNLDWQRIFKYPNYYLDGVLSDEELESNFIYEMPEDIRASFSNSKMCISMSIKPTFNPSAMVSHQKWF